MKLRLALLIVPVLFGCTVFQGECSLTKKERAQLETNIRKYSRENVTDLCSTRIDGKAYKSKELPGLCIVPTIYPGTENCPPAIDGMGYSVYNPKTFEVVTDLPFPAPDSYLRELKARGEL